MNIPGSTPAVENNLNLLMCAREDGGLIAGRIECHTLLSIFWLSPTPLTFEGDAMLIRADTRDLRKPLVMYPDNSNISVTYHNPAGLFATPTMQREFLYDWPDPMVKLERSS